MTRDRRRSVLLDVAERFVERRAELIAIMADEAAKTIAAQGRASMKRLKMCASAFALTAVGVGGAAARGRDVARRRRHQRSHHPRRGARSRRV